MQSNGNISKFIYNFLSLKAFPTHNLQFQHRFWHTINAPNQIVILHNRNSLLKLAPDQLNQTLALFLFQIWLTNISDTNNINVPFCRPLKTFALDYIYHS